MSDGEEGFLGLKVGSLALKAPVFAQPGTTLGEAARAKRAARLSASQVGMIEKIQKQAAPEVVAAVRAGDISLNAAAVVATLPEEEQRAAAAARRSSAEQSSISASYGSSARYHSSIVNSGWCRRLRSPLRKTRASVNSRGRPPATSFLQANSGEVCR